MEPAASRPQMAWSNLPGRVTEQPKRFLACIAAGQLAGLAFLGFLVLVYLAFESERPFEWPVRVVAGFLLGEKALEAPDGLTYALGIGVNQLIPALFWSAVYAWFVMSPRFPTRNSTCIALGLGIGVLAIAVDVYFILPPGMTVLHDQDFWWEHIRRSWDWIAHGVYGLAMGYFFTVLQPRIEKVRPSVRIDI
ncbi:hypothetical protein [Vulgatibacter incomptus]|uniref:Uncharacterized protein n=1 Tax=Vulgatibacter incomptus TaxID=1391653 RepID=A0A0K1P9R8_9BACT|nr:hypothetical protein [Vulgatibacter incomptus]AKU90242.1 hypothetical protein AKJ08_0629 [Vulgatibacter incomptus]